MPPLAAKNDWYYFLKKKTMTQRSTAKAWVEHWISRRNAVAHHCVCNYSLMRNAPLGPMKVRLHNTSKPTVMGSVHCRQTLISRDISHPDGCLVDLRLAISQQYLHTISFVTLQRHLGRAANSSGFLWRGARLGGRTMAQVNEETGPGYYR